MKSPRGLWIGFQPSFRTVLNLNGGVFGTIVVIHIFTMKIGDILTPTLESEGHLVAI
jgi:hypothetical protein